MPIPNSAEVVVRLTVGAWEPEEDSRILLFRAPCWTFKVPG